MNEQIVAMYQLESVLPIEQAAALVAAEQSTGTFVAVPGETAAVRARHGAEVLAVDDVERPGAPSLPTKRVSAGDAPPLFAGTVRIAFPLDNIGTSLAGLLTTVAGNLFELQDLTGVKLLDLELPPAFRQAYPGPAFGPAGTRKLLNRSEGPLIGTIVKPSVGLSPAALAELVATLVDAGVDFIKDDELLADPPHCPLTERVQAVTKVLDAHRERTGRNVMYAFNITADIERMKRHHDVVVEAGGTCVMVCAHTVGLPAVAWLRNFSAVPIHGHRAGLAAQMRAPGLGVAFGAWQKLARLAGADQLHTIGFQSKFYETDDEVARSIAAVRQPLFADDAYACLPVLSSAQWAGTIPATWERLQHADVLFLAGGGILAHPDGPAAGVEALREGWQAAMEGEALSEFAKRHPALARALDSFTRQEP